MANQRAFSQSADSILQAYFSKVSGGNINNWAQVSSLYCETIGFYNADLTGKASFEFDQLTPTYSKFYCVWPNLQLEQGYSDSSFTQLTSYFLYKNDILTIKIGNLPPIRRKTKAKFEFDAVRIHDHYKNASAVKVQGRVTLKGDSTDCFEILIKSENDVEHLFVNSKTFLLDARRIEKSDYLLRYYRYTRFGELLIPLSEISFRNSVPFAWKDYLKIEVNPTIDLRIFDID